MKTLIEQLVRDAAQAIRQFPGDETIRRIDSNAQRLNRMISNQAPDGPRRKPERPNPDGRVTKADA